MRLLAVRPDVHPVDVGAGPSGGEGFAAFPPTRGKFGLPIRALESEELDLVAVHGLHPLEGPRQRGSFGLLLYAYSTALDPNVLVLVAV